MIAPYAIDVEDEISKRIRRGIEWYHRDTSREVHPFTIPAPREPAAPAEPEPAPEPAAAPPTLDDVIGNAPAVLQIRTALDAHRARGGKGAFPHVLLSSPGGCGKTLLAGIIAREVKRPLRLQMGQSLSTPARVADVFLSLKAGDVLFIDEMHGLKPQCQETLYRAMEEGILVPVEKAGKPVGPPIKLKTFTLIGATTDAWALLPSLLQRFKYRVSLERLTPADLAAAIASRAERKSIALTDEAAGMIADRAHGTPRLAVGLLDGCLDAAAAQWRVGIDADVVTMTCAIWGIDDLGLDAVARKYLSYLAEAGGEPVRLNVLATKLDGLSRRTVEMRVEPDLVWLGLISKDADGRRLTDAGREHLTRKVKP